ncbi:MAG: energy transducer TonB [Aquabacterium sp.]
MSASVSATALDRPVRRLFAPPAVYPLVLRKWGNSGLVEMVFDVDESGHAGNIEVLASPHPAFEQAAVDNVLRSRYQPALKNGLPVRSRVGQPVHFTLTRPSSVNQVEDEGMAPFDFPSKGDSTSPPEFQYDKPPGIKLMAPLVYPLAQLREGVFGWAQLLVIVDPAGRVDAVKVLSASDPAFGVAASAAWSSTSFYPATKAGQPCWAAFKYRQEFDRFDREAPQWKDIGRLLDGMRQTSGQGPYTLRALDGMPRALYSPAPVYPTGQMQRQGVHGEVKIEFYIDKEGKALLPRVLKADDEWLGAMAATSVLRWRFEPPRVKGEAVDALVTMPFRFEPVPTSSAPSN